MGAARSSKVGLRPILSARRPQGRGPRTAPKASREPIHDSSTVVMRTPKGLSSSLSSSVRMARTGEDQVQAMPLDIERRFPEMRQKVFDKKSYVWFSF